jgi:hypothetical protein
MAACAVATRPSPKEKSRPAAAHVDVFIGDAMARDNVALMQTPDAAGAGRNCDCGFSPIPFWHGRQKNGCQES